MNNNFFVSFIISSIAGLSTVLGSLVIFFKWRRENINKFIVFSLSLAFSIMIGISVVELIPEASFKILRNYHLIKGIVNVFISFGIGVGVILILNNNILNKEQDLYRLGLLSMIVLMIHNFPEGIITFLSSYQDVNLGIKLAMAIMMHNIPEGISIAVPVYYATGNKLKAIKMTLISGLAEPLGAMLAYIFISKYINDGIIGLILMFVAGIMITLSIHDLFPKSKSYHEDKYIYIGIIVGIVLLIINDLF